MRLTLIAIAIVLRGASSMLTTTSLLMHTNQLRTIDELAAPVKAARLRSILAQLKESLATWAGDATELAAPELQGLAELQSEFVTEQLRKVLPAGVRSAVNTVEISPQFAQSVVTTDPTQLNLVALSDDLFKSVYGAEALAQQAGTAHLALPLPKVPLLRCLMARFLLKHFAALRRAGGAVQPSGT
jgi:hypothetical protein